FYPPKKIELDTNGSNWTLTLSLHEMRKDQPAVLINMADFEKRYNTAKAKKKSVKSGRKPAHLTTASLIDLLHARVELPKGNQLGSLFEGMTGEAVTIEFNKTAGAQAIIIKWPNPNS
ncbi:MAG TPA: hypothetical protein DCE44_08560, partial [Verrucomicrobiales bacterium]|nr:hypothetical protein [Verrucomicrobiales bacterium]